MGFLDMGISIVSSVVSVCSSIGGSVMGAIGSFANKIIADPIPHIPLHGLEIINIGIKIVVGIINSVVEIFTPKPKEETPEEIGLKAELAEKKPEDFDSINEYIKYLREEIEIDDERLEELSPEERTSYAMVGAGLYVKQVEELNGIELPPDFWRTLSSLKYNDKITEQMPGELIIFMKEHGITSGKTFSDFVDGKLPVGCDDQRNMFDALKDTYKKEYPDATDGEINYKINELN